MDIGTLSSRYQPDIDEELRSRIGNSSLPLYHMMRYHLGWVDELGQECFPSGGKLLRPGLCLLSCESVGGNWKKALPAAAALELLHNFTLIHDDIEDGDRKRRGMPTVWHVWGQAQGINTGDALHVLARMALLGLEENGIPPDKVLRAARLLDETCLRLCEGQYLDISFEQQLNIEVDDYLEMIGGKTAALFACSLEMGALLGTENEQTIGHLSEFGRNLGLAFQIQDDVLGIWGRNSKTGKSTASDIGKKKKTLPVIYGIREADVVNREDLLAIYAQETISQKDLPRVLMILDSTGARQYAEGIAREYCEKSLAALAEAKIGPSAQDEFAQLVGFMMGREY